VSLPRIDYTGQEAEVTITELRASPGDLFDRVARGMTVHVTKGGKRIAVISPPDTVINADGSWSGARPIMMGIRP